MNRYVIQLPPSNWVENYVDNLAIEQGIVERATVSLKSTLAWLLSLIFQHDRIVVDVELLRT